MKRNYRKTLTHITPFWYNPNISDIRSDDSALEGLIMSGQIKCNTCSKKMLSTGQGRGTCPKCGSPYCHITVYWQGEYHPYYRDKDNNVFTYTIALRQLVIMNAQMEAGEFQPEEWETGFLQERRMDHAINQWLTEIKMLVALKKKNPSTYNTYRTHVTRNILIEKYGLGKYDVL